jgi:ubiquitin-activating enzyme E1
MAEIDNTLYDRQIRTYGEDAIKKIVSSSVLIYGLEKGLGTEVAKNLTLGGVQNIYLYDNNYINPTEDFETGFYYNNDSILKTYSEALVDKLQELNPYVTIKAVTDFKQDQNVTIIINQPTEVINEISNYTRTIESKLVVLYSKGISGVLFVDAGNLHVINDVTGENIESVQIGEISNSGLVKCTTFSSHDFQTGDFIRFENLEGTNLEQFNKEWKIRAINKVTFQLEDYLNTEPFVFINGTAVYIKKSLEISNQTWQEQIINPSIIFSFDTELSRKLIDTYLKMFSNSIYDEMPFIWSDENNHFMEANNIPLPNYARTFKYELMPIVSLMGSMAASEAIKLITNKYMPINQWFTWCDDNIVPNNKPNYLNARTTYGILYGTELEEKLLNSKWFIVGSGAIGCELLKNLAYMNIGNQELGNGSIIITDPDLIEKSNLNRQFLFRLQHIGKHKSETASESIKQMKSTINIIPFIQKVGNDNIEFIDNIMDLNITGIFNALDNIKARKYMDQVAFANNLPLFESGTTGTKGNTQPVIPFVTETYSNSSDPEEEKTYPICTIKSFPNEIFHTIYWAMDQFEFFNRAPTTINKWIENSKTIEELSPIEKKVAFEDIHELTIKHPTQKLGVESCCMWAIDMFIDNYYNSIIQLLNSFPPEHEITPGVKFWSAGKRCPRPIMFNKDDNIHFNYIKVTTQIIAKMSGLEYNISDQELKEIMNQYKYQEFVPKNIKIASNDSEIQNNVDLLNHNIIIGSPDEFKQTYVPLIFDKDDELDIEWITSASNMRAINYGIPTATCQQTKGIAGKIIPAIATTTSAVSGLICIEMLKYLMGFNKINNYRSTFINLAEPIVVYSEPLSAPIIEISGKKINSWVKLEYSKNTTIQEFKNYYEQMFNINITMIAINTYIVYADFLDSESLNYMLLDIIKNSLETDSIPKQVIISITTEELNDLLEITVNVNKM